ncbi:hypothetical protein [Streptomyces sp. NPDC005423]|uniref:hypothetical protein n=1 Tax=Streptomyces sp. NPDC005423 TaxID=3155343 RepID=UPI0033A956EA
MRKRGGDLTVEGGYPVHVEALGHRDDRGIDPAEREVGVLEDQLTPARQIGGSEVDQLECSPCDLGEKGRFDLGQRSSSRQTSVMTGLGSRRRPVSEVSREAHSG